MSVFKGLLLVACLPLAACATGFSQEDAREFCPSVSIVKEAKNRVSYPGGAPGRSRRDYDHIAVILGAQATCGINAAGEMIADVAVSYAVEPGTLYTGAATNEVFAAVSHGGRDMIRKGTATATVTPEAGGHATATAVVRGLLIGPKGVEEQALDIIVGFEGGTAQ